MKKFQMIAFLFIGIVLANNHNCFSFQVFKVEGYIYDASEKIPLIAEILVFNFENDSLSYSGISNRLGFYSFTVSPGIYEVTFEKSNYLKQSIIINTSAFEYFGQNLIRYNTFLTKITNDEENWFNYVIFFDYKSVIVKPEYYRIIFKMIDSLKNRDDVLLELAVHSDDIGSQEYNIQLTKKRGESVKNLLTSLGLDEDRIRIVPYGKMMPRYPNDSEANRAKNRRCEFRVVYINSK